MRSWSVREGMWPLLLALVATGSLVWAGCDRGEPRERDAARGEAVEAEPSGPAVDEADALGLSDTPWKGGDEALVTIVEFSSYQCPFCGRVQPTLNRILEEYGDDVRIFFKQHPLDMQANSRPAARASLAAHAQGKFWEYHDILMANQRALERSNLEAYAEQVGLDMEQFRADLDADWTNEKVDADLATASARGIRGTPNFLINGRQVTGAVPFEQFQTVIEAEIEAGRALREAGESTGAILAARLEANAQAAPAEQQRPPQPDPDAKMYVPVGNSPAKGGSEPLVTIVEFSSYQCPFCNRVRPTLDELLEQYGDDISIVFKHRPLTPMQQMSEPAARAAIAAQNQDRFWDYHAGIFENQRNLSEAVFTQIAEELGLNMERFHADMASEETTARLNEDTSLADRVQARGTPHFFINGYRLAGAQPVDNFRRIVDREIAVARGLLEEGVPRAEIYTRVMADAERGAPPMR